MIEKLLKTFIELDCYMYEYLPSVYPNKDGYIIYKKHGERNFIVSQGQFKPESERVWGVVTNIHSFTMDKMLNINTLQVLLLNALYTKRLGAKLDIEAIEDTIEAPILRQMDADFEEFKQSFINMVRKTLKRNTFKVISNDN